MYFTAQFSLDPSKETLVNAVKPTHAFGRMLFFLSAGLVSKKEEEETFTAVAILQQLNRALRSVGITNIVRLAKDETDFYFDEEGRQDDLQEAMEQFDRQTDRYESELFETLFLVVEHHDAQFKYLIDVQIRRRHRLGEHPINLTLNAVPVDFGIEDGDGVDAVKEKMGDVFASQTAYDGFRRSRQAHFEGFVAKLQQALSMYIRCDDLKVETDVRVVRPSRPVASPEDMEHERRAAAQPQPVFHGYAGFDTFFLYAWLWSSMSHQHHIHYSDVTVVDGHGEPVFEVGAQGFDAGDGAALDPAQDFVPPPAEDAVFFGDNGYADQIQEAGLLTPTTAEVSGDSDAWLDSGGGDASCSSCSSCSSCGGD